MLAKAILGLLAIMALLTPRGSGFVILVEPNEEECYYELLYAGDKMGVTFEVGAGGRLDVDFQITTPSGRILYDGQRETTNTYTFVAEETGRFTYCFSNKMSIRAQKTVTFAVVTNDQKFPTQVQQEQKSPEESGLENEVQELMAAMRAVKDNQQYLRVRERAHRNTAESTNSRVQWWSIFQVLILFVVCVFQIFYLRNFFEVKQTV